MSSNWTRRDVIRVVRELSKLGLLERIRPGLLLLPAFRSVLGQRNAGQLPSLSDIYGSSPPDLTQMAMDTISNYVQATTDAVAQTSADMASLPLAVASPETVGQYLSRLKAGDPLFQFDVRPDVQANIGRIGNLSVNTSRSLDLSVTYAYGPYRVGLDNNLNVSIGVGLSFRPYGVNVPGVNLTTVPSQFLSGTANIRASSTLPPVRGTLTITAEPAQGFYNIGGGIIRDFYNSVLATSGSPWRWTTSGWVMR